MTTQTRPPAATIVHCVAALLLVACDAEPSRCVVTARKLAYTEPTSAGLSAEQLMSTLAGPFMGTLTWHGGAEVQVQPPSGATDLGLSLIHDGEAVELHESEAQGLAPNERLACSDTLVIPALLKMTTSDGAIDGQWPVEVRYELGSSALAVELRPFGPGNAGTFSAALMHPEDWDTSELFLGSSFTATGATGAIVLAASRELASAGNVEDSAGLDVRLATWTLARP